jgi:hypothetical protein
MFASFCVLLLGAGAAYGAGMATTGQAKGSGATSYLNFEGRINLNSCRGSLRGHGGRTSGW